MAFDTQAAIIAQNSATAAATIVSALIAADKVDVETAQAVFDSIRQDIFSGTLALANETETGAPQRTGGGFPRSGGAPRGKTEPGTVEIGNWSKKHAGKTVAEVYAADPSYIQWLADYGKNDYMKRVAGEYLATVAA